MRTRTGQIFIIGTLNNDGGVISIGQLERLTKVIEQRLEEFILGGVLLPHLRQWGAQGIIPLDDLCLGSRHVLSSSTDPSLWFVTPSGHA
jgi:hypothetical protein